MRVQRSDLQSLSRMRLREARALYAVGAWSGAYYLAGYSAECALKACIARATRANEFPDKERAVRAFSHDLEGLVKAAELLPSWKARLRGAEFSGNWATVKDWKVESRYEIKSEIEAHDLLKALTARRHGILPWIRQHW